jgi:hypothetical protein
VPVQPPREDQPLPVSKRWEGQAGQSAQGEVSQAIAQQYRQAGLAGKGLTSHGLQPTPTTRVPAPARAGYGPGGLPILQEAFEFILGLWAVMGRRSCVISECDLSSERTPLSA